MISFTNDPNDLNTVIRLRPDRPPRSLPCVGPEITFGNHDPRRGRELDGVEVTELKIGFSKVSRIIQILNRKFRRVLSMRRRCYSSLIFLLRWGIGGGILPGITMARRMSIDRVSHRRVVPVPQPRWVNLVTSQDIHHTGGTTKIGPS